MTNTDTANSPRVESDIVQDSINAIRFLSVDSVQKADSGHPGAPLGLAPLAYTLWTRHMSYDPERPDWIDRDRFVLSAGHASMLLYSSLHLAGYDCTIEDLKNFREYGSRTPGHPERHDLAGIEVTTGPLGQGLANAVGMALAERILAAEFNDDENTIIDHHTWCIASDGDMMEGVTSEASSVAGYWGLGKLIVFYDQNHVSLSGPTDVTFTEDTAARYRSYGWQTLEVEDANDVQAIDAAIEKARAETTRPSLIAVNSHIGYGSPLVDTYKVHGSPMGAENVALTRERLGWNYAPFEIPNEIYKHWRSGSNNGTAQYERWEQRWNIYKAKSPALAQELERRFRNELPEKWNLEMPTYSTTDKPEATRVSGGKALNALAINMPEIIGGDADLWPSTMTQLVNRGAVSPGKWRERNICYGVREHAMGSITNGIMCHGGFRAFTATFFCFSDYMKPALRLAALMKLPAVFVFTHDSIGLGQDGPTHQPIEHLAALRALPGMSLIRPADPNEAVQAWEVATAHTDGPTTLVFSRQGLPVMDTTNMKVEAGAYTYLNGKDAVIVGTGSEVSIAIDARELLANDGIEAAVVSMPSWDLFRKQDRQYQESVLPPGVPKVAVEAGSPLGWHEFVDDVVALNRFGASAPADEVYKHLGITAENVVAHVKKLLDK